MMNFLVPFNDPGSPRRSAKDGNNEGLRSRQGKGEGEQRKGGRNDHEKNRLAEVGRIVRENVAGTQPRYKEKLTAKAVSVRIPPR
jgi:hypothetical protein